MLNYLKFSTMQGRHAGRVGPLSPRDAAMSPAAELVMARADALAAISETRMR